MHHLYKLSKVRDVGAFLLDFLFCFILSLFNSKLEFSYYNKKLWKVIDNLNACFELLILWVATNKIERIWALSRCFQRHFWLTPGASILIFHDFNFEGTYVLGSSNWALALYIDCTFYTRWYRFFLLILLWRDQAVQSRD